MYPPSLSQDMKTRAFVASNGELGVLASDVQQFLNACRADDVKVFGWELWIVEHRWTGENVPLAAAGSWCGGIPLRDRTVLSIVGGDGDADEVERQFAAFDVGKKVLHEWLPYVRINFTLN